MAKPSVINYSQINQTAINGDVHVTVVDAAVINIIVDHKSSSVINANTINSIVINGLVGASGGIIQTHIITVQDASISTSVENVTISQIHLPSVANASITLTSQKVFIEKAQGGNLFVTVTEPDTTVHRFSFEGIKA